MGQRLDDSEAAPLQARPLNNFLTYRISALNARMNRQASDILSRHGNLKLPEWRVVEVLAVYGELTGSKVGELAGLDAGLVSRTLQALSQRNLILQRRSTIDRRVTFVSNSIAGRAMADVIFPLMQARQQKLMAALGDQEQQVVFNILSKLDAAAMQRDAESGDEKAVTESWSNEGQAETI